MGGVCSAKGGGGGKALYWVLVRKPEGKRQLGRARPRLEDNIKVDLREVGCGFMDWIELARGWYSLWALVTEVMNLRVP